MRAWIYNRALLPLTSKWYAAVLERLPDGARLLDVGIGTGGALIRNQETLRAKNVEVVGIDIDEDYVRQCQKSIDKNNLSDIVRVELQSVYDFNEGDFDAIYFSASFMLLPDPDSAPRACQRALRPKRSAVLHPDHRGVALEVDGEGKAPAQKLTSIDFGKVTYENDFLATMASGGVALIENTSLGGNKARSYRLFVGEPSA